MRKVVARKRDLYQALLDVGIVEPCLLPLEPFRPRRRSRKPRKPHGRPLTFGAADDAFMLAVFLWRNERESIAQAA